MKTMVVWVLLAYLGSGFDAGGPIVIDNIASEADCLRVGRAVIASAEREHFSVVTTRCMAIRKVFP